jgi:hypothetical protein
MRDKRSLQFGEHESEDQLDTRLSRLQYRKKAVPVDNMTAYKASRGTAPLTFNLNARRQ